MYKTLIFFKRMDESCRSVENAQTFLTCHIFLFSGFNWNLDFSLLHKIYRNYEQFTFQFQQTSLNIFTNNSISNRRFNPHLRLQIPVCDQLL
jgi:hypothetical protein